MFGKAWNRIACYLLVFLFAIMPLNGLAESEDAGTILSTESPRLTFEMGTKASMNGISVVDLHGTWHEMGRQYGALLKDELTEVYLFVETIIISSITARASAISLSFAPSENK